ILSGVEGLHSAAVGQLVAEASASPGETTQELKIVVGAPLDPRSSARPLTVARLPSSVTGSELIGASRDGIGAFSDDRRSLVYAVDLSSGKLLWQRSGVRAPKD